MSTFGLGLCASRYEGVIRCEAAGGEARCASDERVLPADLPVLLEGERKPAERRERVPSTPRRFPTLPRPVLLEKRPPLTTTNA